MFAGAYLRSPAADKVKYGALNITCDVRGVTSAHTYGDSYLLLKRGVRLRASFAFYDTSSPEVRKCLATCEHYAHVLNAYVDGELEAALHVGAGRAEHGTNGAAVQRYKEVQVHGPLELSRHVEAVVGALQHQYAACSCCRLRPPSCRAALQSMGGTAAMPPCWPPWRRSASSTAPPCFGWTTC